MNIHVSGLRSFRSCRKKWALSQENYIPIEEADHFIIGRAIHVWMEHFYSGENPWDGLKTYYVENPRATQELVQTIAAHYEKHVGVATKMQLQWNDSEFEWLVHEMPFEIPITEFPGHNYAGRIDGVVRHIPTGKFYVWEHKTSSRPDNLIHSLLWDDQSILYTMAAEVKLGVPIHGVLYNVILSDQPKMADILKDGTVSMNRSKPTSFHSFKAQLLQRYNRIPEEYEDHLDYLWTVVESKWFRRHEHIVTGEMRKSLWEEVLIQIDEMIHPRIYPTRGYTCVFCGFQQHCFAGKPLEEIAIKKEIE